MAGRLPQPYRGQPRPKYLKPRRQFRNLREEKLSDTITINLFLFLSITLLVIGMLSSGSGGDALSIGVLIAISFMGLILTAAIADGTKSINKFRNSYDFDASKLEETQADNKSDDEQQ